jgi:hypothetical protein
LFELSARYEALGGTAKGSEMGEFDCVQTFRAVLMASTRSAYLFNLAALDERTPCHPSARQAPGESTPDFLARAMTEDHGFTVPGRSLFAPEVVDGQE